MKSLQFAILQVYGADEDEHYTNTNNYIQIYNMQRYNNSKLSIANN